MLEKELVINNRFLFKNFDFLATIVLFNIQIITVV